VTDTGRPLRVSIVTGILFVSMAAILAWTAWSVRNVTRDNARVLCNVLAIERQTRIEELAVTPGTADDLKNQLERINELYDRIASPIQHCDVRRARS
jgi:type VI protein secretion system component VasK